MTPYLCVTSQAKDDDIKRMYLRINHPNISSVEIELSPPQALALATDILNHFPISNVKPDYVED